VAVVSGLWWSAVRVERQRWKAEMTGEMAMGGAAGSVGDDDTKGRGLPWFGFAREGLEALALWFRFLGQREGHWFWFVFGPGKGEQLVEPAGREEKNQSWGRRRTLGEDRFRSFLGFFLFCGVSPNYKMLPPPFCVLKATIYR